jgi:hypothetical protein
MRSVTLRDDGGTEYGGADATDPVYFTINIEQVNDDPKFTIAGCPPAIPVQDQVHCAPSPSSCASSGDACHVTIIINENCDDCPPGPGGVPTGGCFTAEGFALASPSWRDTPDERQQTITFDVSSVSGGIHPGGAGFSTPGGGNKSANASLSAEGVLTICPPHNMHGNETFSVSLTDSEGGTFGPMEISLVVMPVNSRPSFDICPDCVGSCCQVGSCCAPQLPGEDGAVIFWAGDPDGVQGQAFALPDPGPNEAEQGANFTVSVLNVWANSSSDSGIDATNSTVEDNSSLIYPAVRFSTEPTIDPSGLINFTPSPAHLSGGVAKLTVFMSDDGLSWDEQAGTVALCAKYDLLPFLHLAAYSFPDR